MHFDVTDVSRVDIGVAYDALEHAGLIALVRACNAVCLSAVVRVGAYNDTKYWVVVGLGVFQPLEDDCAYRVGTAITTGLIVEGIAVS